jgi:CATRA-Associated Small Protein
MAPSGESGAPERSNSGTVAETKADALDVLSDALQWQLSEARWRAIEQILTTMNTALETGDMAALAAATADLELAGPLRIIPIGPPPVGPTREARYLLNKLVHTLDGTMVGEGPEDGEPGDSAAGDGADDADNSRY